MKIVGQIFREITVCGINRLVHPIDLIHVIALSWYLIVIACGTNENPHLQPSTCMSFNKITLNKLLEKLFTN